MRTLLLVVLMLAFALMTQAGEKKDTQPKPKKDDSAATADTGNKGKKAADKTAADKASAKTGTPASATGQAAGNKSQGKTDGKGANASKGDTIPPGIAKQGPEKIEKWQNSRGQLKTDLDEIYTKNSGKSADKSTREGRANALYDALTNRGMDNNEAASLIKGMAASKDKDDAFDAVRKSIDTATTAGEADTAIVSNVKKIVDGADSAKAISEGLAKWHKTK